MTAAGSPNTFVPARTAARRATAAGTRPVTPSSPLPAISTSPASSRMSLRHAVITAPAASGAPSARTWRSMQVGYSTSSPHSSFTNRPLASATARFQFSTGPTLVWLARTRSRSSGKDRATSTVPSVEASSTTTSSRSSKVWASTDDSVFPMWAALW